MFKCFGEQSEMMVPERTNMQWSLGLIFWSGIGVMVLACGLFLQNGQFLRLFPS
jgi:hypothetical protein